MSTLNVRQLRSTFANQENSALNAKQAGGAAMGKAGGVSRQLGGGRSALGNIANNTQRTTRGAAGPTKEPIKPARGLTKQKATSTLQALKQQENVAPTRVSLDRKVKRNSGGNKSNSPSNEEPMDTQESLLPQEVPVPVQIPSADVEMADEAIVDPSVEDIDKEDQGNTQMLPEYVNEIYAYMRDLELRQAVMANYLAAPENVKGAIKPRMRNFLVDWLVEVHQQFSLIQETLYLTVGILDRYLQVEAGATTTKQLQLVGVTAMLLASKYEEMYPPEIGDFVYITDKAYKESEIRAMEIKILKALSFDLGRPLPINFLRRCSKAGLVDEHTHGLAKYLMELSIVDYRMSHIEPSRIAAASLALAMRLLDPHHTPVDQLWTPTLVHYTAYTLREITEPIRALAETLLDIHHSQGINATHYTPAGSSKKVKAIRAVPKKYCGKKFGKIALLKVVNHTEGREMLEAIVRGRMC